MEITVESRPAEGGRTVVEVSGEVDVYSAPALDTHLTDLIDGGQSRLIIDLRRVDFLDSTGLGVLVKALKRTREQSGSMDIVAADDRIVKVFRITGLDAVIPIHATPDAALAS